MPAISPLSVAIHSRPLLSKVTLSGQVSQPSAEVAG